jgi:hypothetical protein
MRSALRLLAPALRSATASSRASSSRTKLFVGAVAGGTLAYALVPHKQTLLLESGSSGEFYSVFVNSKCSDAVSR